VTNQLNRPFEDVHFSNLISLLDRERSFTLFTLSGQKKQLAEFLATASWHGINAVRWSVGRKG
jgi:hypothetical protein